MNSKTDARQKTHLPSQPMTRRERKKQNQRAELLEAALALFREHGFDNVSMELVAGRADVAATTLYNYFPTKRSLLLAISQADMERLHSDRDQWLNGLPEEPVEALIEETRREWSVVGSPNEKDLWRHLLATSILAYGREDDGSFAVIRKGFEKFLQDLIERWVKRGKLRPDTDAATLATVISAIRTDAFRKYVSLDETQIDDVLTQTAPLLRLVLGSCMTREADRCRTTLGRRRVDRSQPRRRGPAI